VSVGAIRTHGRLVRRYLWRGEPPDDTSRCAGTLMLADCVSGPNVSEAGLRAATEEMMKADGWVGSTDSVRVCQKCADGKSMIEDARNSERRTAERGGQGRSWDDVGRSCLVGNRPSLGTGGRCVPAPSRHPLPRTAPRISSQPPYRIRNLLTHFPHRWSDFRTALPCL
jgi:hypothetical protein